MHIVYIERALCTLSAVCAHCAEEQGKGEEGETMAESNLGDSANLPAPDY